MTCALLQRTPTTAEVQVIDSRIRFRLDDGRIGFIRQALAEKLQAAGEEEVAGLIG